MEVVVVVHHLVHRVQEVHLVPLQHLERVMVVLLVHMALELVH
jgi:hypothetical protein